MRGGGAGGGGGEVWGRQLHLPGLDCPQGTGHQLQPDSQAGRLTGEEGIVH